VKFFDDDVRVAPIVYTPTVGQACLQFGALYRRARGMYFSANDKGEMRSMVYNWPEDEVSALMLSYRSAFFFSLLMRTLC
jgi:malic enzyme